MCARHRTLVFNETHHHALRDTAEEPLRLLKLFIRANTDRSMLLQ